MASLTSEVTQGQVTEFIARMGRHGLTSGMVKLLNGDDEAMHRFVHEGLVSLDGKKPLQLRACVDYVVPVYGLLLQLFDRVDDRFKDGIALAPTVLCRDLSQEPSELEFELIRLGKGESLIEVLASLEDRGVRPALYQELVSFSRVFANFQRRFKIISTGSCTEIGELIYSPCLSGDENERRLGLHWHEDDLEGGERLLVVRE